MTALSGRYLVCYACGLSWLAGGYSIPNSTSNSAEFLDLETSSQVSAVKYWRRVASGVVWPPIDPFDLQRTKRSFTLNFSSIRPCWTAYSAITPPYKIGHCLSGGFWSSAARAFCAARSICKWFVFRLRRRGSGTRLSYARSPHLIPDRGQTR